MSDKDEVIAKAGIVAGQLDVLATAISCLVDSFNEKVEEANDLISELGTDNEDDPEYVEPDYLMELDLSDNDPASLGDELRVTFGLAQNSGKYAPGPSTGQLDYASHGPITDDQFAVNKDKAETMAKEMGLQHPHTGALFELNSYRYFVVGVNDEDAVLLAVRARNGVLHKFEGADIDKIVGNDDDTKPVL